MQRGGQGGVGRPDQRKGRGEGAESHVAVGAALAVELADLGAGAHHLPPRSPRLLQHRPPRGAAAFRGMVSTHRLRDAGPVRGAARLDGGCQPLGLRLGPCRGVAVDLAPLGRRRSRQRRVGAGAAAAELERGRSRGRPREVPPRGGGAGQQASKRPHVAPSRCAAPSMPSKPCCSLGTEPPTAAGNPRPDGRRAAKGGVHDGNEPRCYWYLTEMLGRSIT